MQIYKITDFHMVEICFVALLHHILIHLIHIVKLCHQHKLKLCFVTARHFFIVSKTCLLYMKSTHIRGLVK